MYDWSLDMSKLKPRSTGGIVTRSSNKKLFKLRKPRTEKYKKCFAYSGMKKWNSLPESFHYVKAKGPYQVMTKDWILDKSIRANQSQIFPEM